MDSHTHSARVERLEVVETGRRRRWSEEEKLRIVRESLQAPRQVSATAWRHGISRSQLLQWRRSFRADHRLETPAGDVAADLGGMMILV
jgi:transposase